MSNFDIRRPSPARAISVLVNFAALRGVAIMRDAADAVNLDRPAAALAQFHAIGVLARDVVFGGPSVVDRAQIFPGRPELQDAVSGTCTLDPLPLAFECEGSDYIVLSGTGITGYIDANTAVNTVLSYYGGKLRVKQSTDDALYVLAGKPTAETSGAIRLFVESIGA